MAKGSGKTTFKDTVTAYERLRREIAAGRDAPVYLLMGEEGYFIDRIADQLAGTVLTEAERDFNQIVVYGKDTDEGTIINYARQMPMMGRYEVVIVKEAQSLRKPEQLSLYTAAPSPATRARASTSARSSTSTSCKRAKYSNRYVRATTKSRPGWATSSNRRGAR